MLSILFRMKWPNFRLQRSLMVSQNKFESAKLQKNKSDATKELESCVDQSVHDSINILPHLVAKLKVSLGIASP
ncbi:hypothetical protein K7X08_032009 [Anisodus acutangulus]|uniref:Uncharacterized protein n=1 Tax=Anisodus acutangulus TaxID=402998 RepID=A0A9Q1MST5_9SOLA|nr:hypothetical protein K7X08_032009 [Anisodus acutangulus]